MGKAMTILRVIRNSLSLINRKDHLGLALLTLVQMSMGLLDLAGVFLIGFVGVLSVSVVGGVALPSQVQEIRNRPLLDSLSDTELVVWILGFAAVMLIAKSFVSLLLARRTLRFLAARQARMSSQLASQFLSSPLLDIEARSSQDSAFVITMGTQAAIVGVLGAASTALADVSLLLLLGVALTLVDPIVTLFAVLYFGLIALALQRGLSRWATSLGEISANVDIASYTAIQEAIRCYREISVMHRRGAYINRIQKLRWASARAGADQQFVGVVPKYVFEIGLVVGAVGLALAQFQMSDLATAVGILALFIAAASRVMPALLRLQVAALSIRGSSAAAGKAYQLATDLATATQTIGKVPPKNLWFGTRRKREFRPTVEVIDVSFSYPGTENLALRNVSFSASAGMSVALVGATGAGKSTLADLILGVIHAQEGKVLLGGVEASEASAQFPGQLSYVPQEVALVQGNIRDNVALGLPRDSFSDQEVWDALEMAELDAFLRDDRDGLETIIGENGMRLSGGQRQRLGLARALLSEPQFLVLDEATSALDAETEASISDTIGSLKGSMTVITVAHRLATIQNSDLVILLQRGELASAGSFDDARSASAAFNRQAVLLGL